MRHKETGMDSYLLQGTGNMNGPLADRYSNCPLHQAFFQLAIEKHLVEAYYGARVAGSYVVQITQDGIIPWQMPNDVADRANELYDHLMSTPLPPPTTKQRKSSSKLHWQLPGRPKIGNSSNRLQPGKKKYERWLRCTPEPNRPWQL